MSDANAEILTGIGHLTAFQILAEVFAALADVLATLAVGTLEMTTGVTHMLARSIAFDTQALVCLAAQAAIRHNLVFLLIAAHGIAGLRAIPSVYRAGIVAFIL